MNSSVSPLLKLSDKLSEPAYRKATIKTFKNGNRLIDADILMANRMKITVCMYAVGSIAGVKIYKAIPKYVEASSLNSYIDKAYSDLGYDSLLPATGTDAEKDTTDSEEAASTEEE